MNTQIHPEGWTTAATHLSWGIKAGSTIYVAGMLSIDPYTNEMVDGDIKVQTRRVIENIIGVLDAAGASLADVAMNHIFLKDMADYKAMNEVYMEYFQTPRPARFCVKLDMVNPAFLVEIAAVAHVG